MPQWLTAIVSAAIAGIIGFACGAILNKPDQQKHESAIQQYQQTQQSNESTIANHQKEISKLRSALKKEKKKAPKANKYKSDLTSQKKLYFERKDELTKIMWQLIAKCNLEVKKNNRIAIINQTARVEKAIALSDNNTSTIPTLDKIINITEEIIGMPRGYIYGNTIYSESGTKTGWRKGKKFHADKPWAIVMQGYMNIEINLAKKVDGYSWSDVELVNHEWCLKDKAESAVYGPGDYVFGIVPRGKSGWKMTVVEVAGTDPDIAKKVERFR